MQILYKRYKPTPTLAPYIDYFWAVDAPGPQQPKREMLIPTGNPTLLLSSTTSSVLIDPATGAQETTTNKLIGLTTKPYIIEQLVTNHVTCIGAQFTPSGLAAFLPDNPLVNHCMSLVQWLGEAHAKKLLDVISPIQFGSTSINALDIFLQSKIQKLNIIDSDHLTRAVNAIKTYGGQIDVDKLMETLGIQYITLYRLFKRYIGVSPKQFIAIIRFYNFTGQLLQDHSNDPDTFMALMHGYYDQSHASKDFKKFTGISPTTFKSMYNTLARFMHQA